MAETTLAPLDRAPAYRLVYNSIEREILSGRLEVGQPLPAESDLAAQLGVNRSTVREGIRLLEQSGLLQREGARRLRVALPHFMDLASRASRALVMHSVTFQELWEASVLIEPTTAELAAQRVTQEQLVRIADNVARMNAAVDAVERGEPMEVDAFVAMDAEFHDLVAEAAANRVLQLAREPISRLFIPAGRLILPRLKTHRRVLDAHRFILAALEARDPARVREWMRRHMEDFKRGYDRTGFKMDLPLDTAELELTPESLDRG